MHIRETDLLDVVVLKPDRFQDDRGFFSESWNRARLAEVGLEIDFVQDNHSMSVESGTLRGLHYQAPPFAQGKLVRCGRGSLFDVAVDARKGSPSFGKWTGVELSDENGLQVWVPPGFLHGFVTREPMTEVIYKCSAYHAPEADGAVRWDTCDVDWGLNRPPVVSAKDRDAISWAEFDSPFEWSGS